ncbi:carboxymuconolactone decarboxylase family protein [Burkholderiaceae bacterium FT117]|uniref:carboxymuconolactone decarboxylase family protein n=1 Tax=Zeimonas sediminis TaxID=2944268 RepID=UPI002342CE8D|nr:carboxymuconolactone decarboxylase family protein [Zeimonas sediminis]MCM5569731.1 carboxymuconolactone decarboxylase family protein [Zeimonas sediminis]
MSRLKMLPAQPEDPAVAAMFDEVRARGVRPPNLYRVIGHAPEMLRAWLDFAWPLRLNAKTSRRIRELLILRGAQVSGANYEWVHHTKMALAAGVSQAQIDALADWEGSDLFDAEEKAVLRLAQEVTAGPAASAEAIDGLKKVGFDEAAIVELTLTASFYVCVARFLLSMDVELEDDDRA